MFDPFSAALHAAGNRSIFAAPLAIGAGFASSLGPCVAPRFLAVAGMSAGKTRAQSAGLAASFIGGLIVAYASFAGAASLLGRALASSTAVYVLVAIALGAGGLITLWSEPHACARPPSAARASCGAAFLLGAAFAFVVSPCCTPFIVAILAYASASGSACYGAALLALFALGHAAPMIALAIGAQRATGMFYRYGGAGRRAGSTVSAGLMLCLAAYYAVLA